LIREYPEYLWIQPLPTQRGEQDDCFAFYRLRDGCARRY
jgi:hypothetical protein